jgi:hypothetical protein
MELGVLLRAGQPWYEDDRPSFSAIPQSRALKLWMSG